MAPSAGEPASDTADGLRSFILDQMEGEHQSPPSYNSWNGLAPDQGRTFAAQAAEDEVIPEEVERRFVENALRACARMTRETQKSRNKLTLLHQEFDSKVSFSRPFFMPGSSVAFRDCAVATDAFLRFALTGWRVGS
jgi:hypothetical protein